MVDAVVRRLLREGVGVRAVYDVRDVGEGDCGEEACAGVSSWQGQMQPGPGATREGGCAGRAAAQALQRAGWSVEGGVWRAPEEKRENDALFIRPRALLPPPKLPLDDVLPREDVALPSPGCTTSVLPTERHFSESPSFDSTSHLRPRLARP